MKCPHCQKPIVLRSARRSRQKKIAGICITCGRQHKSGQWMCPACGKRRSAKLTEFYYARRRRGICVKCGKEPAAPFARCGACRGQDQFTAEKRKRGIYARNWAGAFRVKTA